LNFAVRSVIRPESSSSKKGLSTLTIDHAWIGVRDRNSRGSPTQWGPYRANFHRSKGELILILVMMRLRERSQADNRELAREEEHSAEKVQTAQQTLKYGIRAFYHRKKKKRGGKNRSTWVRGDKGLGAFQTSRYLQAGVMSGL